MEQTERVEPIEDRYPLVIGPTDSHVTYLESNLPEQARREIRQVVTKNKDLFAWQPADMPGIDPNFLCHKLSVCREAKPIAQRKRKTGEERKKAIEEEVTKLLDADFIREIHYTTWLANVVMVKKSNGKWRMCTDYTDLNKACPKDAYPLPNIDRLVDGAADHKFLTFLDAYSGYNQIRMYPRDEDKTTFVTESANYYYQVMPFDLKNAGATYQRLMDKIFHEQIGKNMEIYVDDMVVKSAETPSHVADLAEVFQSLRRQQMRLNPDKCVFGVSGGKLLANWFQWTEECEASFQMFKQRLDTPPILAKPTPSQVVLYLTISSEAISAVMIQEKDGQQYPIYFISRVLQDAERCMPVDESPKTWMTDILDFIVHGKEPADSSEAKKLRTQAAWYSVVSGELYRRGFFTPLLKCLEHQQANYAVCEVHEGICGSHSRGRTLATKILRAGYYWPTLKTDCADYVKKCAQYQKHGNLIHASATELHNISSPWPFALWGIDILGPFPVAKGQVKFLLVVVDYFTKWIEAESLASISAANVQKFVWKYIVTRFGIPYAIVSDNGLQITDQKFNSFLQNLGIRHRFSSVEHPQSNGQADLAVGPAPPPWEVGGFPRTPVRVLFTVVAATWFLINVRMSRSSSS
uniref:Transposon Ty3-I Gag-Pol polyprotein n=1 Tax=Cajanus cajan TaxID=3821 RepID=A0A151RGH1_CAJCA|nr:Transposon Ty3-I Gag-Pol polyprotein [Cajanus cajan]